MLDIVLVRGSSGKQNRCDLYSCRACIVCACIHDGDWDMRLDKGGGWPGSGHGVCGESSARRAGSQGLLKST